MTDSVPAPPPYTRDASSSERALSVDSRISLLPNGNDLEGVRASILDNVRVLFIIAFNGHKPMPKDFYILTIKTPPWATDRVPNQYHACITFCDSTGKGRQGASMFVQGVQKDTMEEALQALLQKTQEMLGRRWKLPVSPVPSTAALSVYLES